MLAALVRPALAAAARRVEATDGQDLLEVVSAARRAFALAGLACQRLGQVRGVEYLQPLVVAGNAALAAADAVDRAPSAPPVPPLGERARTGLAVVGGIDAAAVWPLGPGDGQAAEVATGVAALAEALATRLLAAIRQAEHAADREALRAAVAHAGVLLAGVTTAPAFD